MDKNNTLKRQSKHSSLHIILNNEKYYFNIYEKNGLESAIIYFKGVKILPSFYLKIQKQSFRVDFKVDGIDILPILKEHIMENYLKNYCNFVSPMSLCWAVSKYYTSRPEKFPFCHM